MNPFTKFTSFLHCLDNVCPLVFLHDKKPYNKAIQKIFNNCAYHLYELSIGSCIGYQSQFQRYINVG